MHSPPSNKTSCTTNLKLSAFLYYCDWVLGIFQKKKTTGILLRNWVTFLLRKCIAHTEKEAFYAPNRPIIATIVKIKQKVCHSVELEIQTKAFQYKNENKLHCFDKIITHENVLCEKLENGEYNISNVFI